MLFPFLYRSRSIDSAICHDTGAPMPALLHRPTLHIGVPMLLPTKFRAAGSRPTRSQRMMNFYKKFKEQTTRSVEYLLWVLAYDPTERQELLDALNLAASFPHPRPSSR